MGRARPGSGSELGMQFCGRERAVARGSTRRGGEYRPSMSSRTTVVSATRQGRRAATPTSRPPDWGPQRGRPRSRVGVPLVETASPGEEAGG